MILRNKIKRRELRVRSKVYGTAERPRLSVYRSNKYISAQIINDDLGKTLVDISNESKDIAKGKTKTEQAFVLVELLASKAKKQKITQLVFDRKGYRYHGRVRNFCEGVRKGGISL